MVDSSEEKKVFSAVPRIIPGSINVEGLSAALSMPDESTRFEKIFEVALSATPNDSSAPILTKDKIVGAINGPLKEHDALIPQIDEAVDRRQSNWDNATETIVSMTMQLNDLMGQAYGNEPGKKPEDKKSEKVEEKKAPERMPMTEFFKRRMATTTISWHMGSKQLDVHQKTTLSEAIADVSINTADSKAVSKILSVDSNTVHGIWNRRLKAVQKIVQNNPKTMLRENVRDWLADILSNSAVPRNMEVHTSDDDGKRIILDILTSLGGEKAVDGVVRIMETASDEGIKIKAIDALGKTGVDSPKRAIVALKKLKESGSVEGKFEGNISVALTAIVTAATEHNKTPFKKARELAEFMGPVLKGEGIGAWGRVSVKSTIIDKRMTSTEEMTRMAVAKMGKGHPIWNRRGERVINAVKGMHRISDRNVSVVGYVKRGTVR